MTGDFVSEEVFDRMNEQSQKRFEWCVIYDVYCKSCDCLNCKYDGSV